MDWKAETFRVTVVLVVASVVLIGAGLAGLNGSLALVVAFVGLAGILGAGRAQLGRAPRAFGHDFGYYGETLWLGPLVAAVAVVVAPDATPAELQALGGLVGLAGMANYFLRPLYRFGYSMLRRVGLAG